MPLTPDDLRAVHRLARHSAVVAIPENHTGLPVPDASLLGPALEAFQATKQASGVLSTLRKLHADTAVGVEQIFTKSAEPGPTTASCLAAILGTKNAGGTGAAPHMAKVGCRAADSSVLDTFPEVVQECPVGPAVPQAFDRHTVKAAQLLASALSAPHSDPQEKGRTPSLKKLAALAIQRPTAVAVPAQQAQQAMQQFMPQAPSCLAASTTRAVGAPTGAGRSPSSHPITSYGGLSADPGVPNGAFGVKNNMG